MLIADWDTTLIAWGTAIPALLMLWGAAVAARKWGRAIVSRWKERILATDKEERHEADARDERLKRDARLEQAATLINQFDGKLTKQTTELTNKINTALGSVKTEVKALSDRMDRAKIPNGH